jgi:hypothetical protein
MLSITLPTYRRKGLSRLALVAAVTAAMSSVLIGPTAATAATPSPAGTAAPSASPSASPTPSTGPNAAPSAAATAAKASPAAATTADPAPAKRAGTTKSTTGTRTTGAVCGGKLTLGAVAKCASISGEQQNVWTVTTTVAQDTLFARLNSVSGDGVGARVTDRSGAIVCYVLPYLNECRLDAAGTYTVTVELSYRSGEGAYSLSVESMRAPSECDTLPANLFSFASAGRSGTLPAGLATRCFKFDQPTGEVLQVSDPGGPGDVRGAIRDGAYQPICTVEYGGRCELSSPGPYRLFLYELYGNESAYTLKLPRLSHPVGCPTLPVVGFGDPGTATGTGSLAAGDGVACHVLTAPAAGAVVVRFNQFANQYLWWTVYDVAGKQICEKWANARSCALPAGGSYTLLVQNQYWEPLPYQVAVASITGGTGCAATTGTNWDQPALLVHQTSALQTNCQPFQGTAGDRILVYRAPTAYNDLYAWIVDEHGTEICTEPAEEDGCALPTTGTFRVVSYLNSWDADSTDLTYRMQVRRLSDPVGCPTVTPGAYNAAPAGSPAGIRCRTLDVPTAGSYRVKAVDADNYPQWASVYDTTGHKLCNGEGCPLPAAGKYTLVLGGGGLTTVLDQDVTYAVALLPWVPVSCPTVSDTGWQDAPQRGRFTAAGQYDCLQLASPTGSRVVELLPGDATGAAAPEVAVVDSTGAQLCDSSWALRQYHCELTGVAPYFAVLNSRDGAPTGAYALGFARTDGPPACPVLPTGDAGATVPTGADRFAVCFSIPADQRAAKESITWKRTSGTGDARLSVFDGEGHRYCGPTGYAVERTVSCTLPAGPVTVILEADGVDATYQLTHRDASLPAA